MKTQKTISREKPISEEKIRRVNFLREKLQESRTILLASCRGLPSKQYHDIKKKLRGNAELYVVKKSLFGRALEGIEKGAIKNLKDSFNADVVLFFSDVDPFRLSALLTEYQSSTKAKAGDVAPKDIEIESGPTELVPGPAISELSSVGLKVAVKEGKLEIIKGVVVVKKGGTISVTVAGVLGKLGINPMKVGFLPLVAYDAKEDAVYLDIRIDIPGTLLLLKDAVHKALGFGVYLVYPTKETISYILSRAALHEKAIARLEKHQTLNSEAAKEEA